jgi:hypothetical protein
LSNKKNNAMNANDLKSFFENSEVAALIADLGLEIEM